MTMHTAGRLYFKHQGDIKMAIDPHGNLFVKGSQSACSNSHDGLVFKSSAKTTPSVSIEENVQREQDGMFNADFIVSEAAPIPHLTTTALMFAKAGAGLVEFTYDQTDPELGGVRVRGKLIKNFATRKNTATIEQIERDNLRDAIIAIDSIFYPGTFDAADPNDPFPNGGVSYWDKQDEIHQATHVHGGPSFVPWHRELLNRFEALLRQADPLVSLHYWDWQTDPRNSPNGKGGATNLLSADFMGSASGRVGAPFDTLDNGGVFAGSREQTGNPADPPVEITRNVDSGVPSIPLDATVLSTGDDLPNQNHWPSMRVALENAHNIVHGYIGGDIGFAHSAFEDPFVYLLHSNVDRLWASWQLKPGKEWRLDPDQVYGTETNHARILEDLEPWAGGEGTRPWAPPENEQVQKNSRDPSVVEPPLYDEYVYAGKWLSLQKTPGDSQAIGDNFGVFAVHAALLHTGKVLLFSGRTETAGFLYDSWIWDPVTQTASGPQPFNPALGPEAQWADDKDIDLFCAHQVFLEDGRLLVIGGASADTEGDAHGNASIHIFDPVAEQWDKLSGRMIRGRWYPTAVTMPDGRVTIFSGRPASGVVAETEIVESPDYLPQVIAGGNKPLPIYPGLHLVKGGKIFFTGTAWRYEISPGDTVSFRMTGPTQGVWEDYPDPADPARRLEPLNPFREEGTSVLLPPAQAGRILLIGGGFWDFSNDEQVSDVQPRSVEILETQGVTPVWIRVGTMHHARINVNAVLLPDGKVLIVGGHNKFKFDHDSGADDRTPPGGHVFKAEIFDPEIALDPSDPSDPFIDTCEMQRARMYHSVALLLPDGSVFLAGGDDFHAPPTSPGEPFPGDQKNFEIYQPPYFFKGERPEIDDLTQAGNPTDQINYGGQLVVETKQAACIDQVVLMRPGAITHHTDTEQRHIPLEFAKQPGQLLVQVLNDSTVAPPGYYMVFIVDNEGRPCKQAKFVRLT